MTVLICGLVRFDGAMPDEEPVARMLAAMTPPGRAATPALGRQGAAVFGQLRIAMGADTAPAPAEILAGDGALVAADARFYPRDAAPAPAGVLEALAVPGFPAAIGGDFAIARWQGGVLTLWRDHFGVRPLFVTAVAGAFAAFASIPGALIAAGLAERRLDPAAMASLALDMFGFGAHSWFKGVRRVRRAECLRIDASGLAARRYWRPKAEGRWRGGFEDAAGELRLRLDRAVRRRLLPGHPATGHMSGGLDSTAVSVLAARAVAEAGGRYTGYSFREGSDPSGIAPREECADLDTATAAEGNIDIVALTHPGLHRIVLGGICPDSGVLCSPLNPDMAAAADAAARGAPVVLTGFGGDQGVTNPGSPAISELALRLSWRRLARLVGKIARERGERRGAILRGGLLVQGVPPRLRHRIRMLKRSARSEMAARLAVLAPARRRSARPAINPARATVAADIRARFEDDALADALEGFALLGARHGVTYAHPMLDCDLTDFLMTLPGEYFVADGVGRALFREAMRGVLPDPIRLRPDKLFAYPVEALRIARDRDWIIAEIDRLGRCPLVRAHLAPEAIAGIFAAWPDEAEIGAALSRPGDPPIFSMLHVGALIAAAFIEANAALGAT